MSGFRIHNHKGKQVSILDEAAPEAPRPRLVRSGESPDSWPTTHRRAGLDAPPRNPSSYSPYSYAQYPYQLPTPPSQPSPNQRRTHEDDRMPGCPRKEGEYFNSRPYHGDQGQLPSPPVSPEAQQMQYTYQTNTGVLPSIEQSHPTASQGPLYHGQRPSYPSHHQRQLSDVYPTPGTMTPADTPQPEGTPCRMNEYAPRYQHPPNQPLPVSHYPPGQEGYIVTQSPTEATTMRFVSYPQPAVQHPPQPAHAARFEATPIGCVVYRHPHPQSQCVVVQPAPQDPKPAKGKSNYPCPLAKEYNCGSYFTTSGHARRHAKKHTGEKSQICPECKKSFARKDNMDQHRKTHRRYGRGGEDLRSASPAPELKPTSQHVDIEKGRITKQKHGSERVERQRRLQQNVEHAFERLTTHERPPSPEDAMSSQTEGSASPSAAPAQVRLALRSRRAQATHRRAHRPTLSDLANIAELAPRAGAHENEESRAQSSKDSEHSSD